MTPAGTSRPASFMSATATALAGPATRYHDGVATTDAELMRARLRQAFDLHEAGVSMRRASLRREHPDAGPGRSTVSSGSGSRPAPAPSTVTRSGDRTLEPAS